MTTKNNSKEKKYDGSGSYEDAIENKIKEEKTDNNPSSFVEKSFEELLTETRAKITQENYYQTEKVIVGSSIVTIHFKPLSHRLLSEMQRLPQVEMVPFILTNTLYSAVENRLYTKDELDALFEGLGGLTEIIGSKILEESGFTVPSRMNSNPFP